MTGYLSPRADTYVYLEKLSGYIKYLEGKKYRNETENQAIIDLKTLLIISHDNLTTMYYGPASGPIA